MKNSELIKELEGQVGLLREALRKIADGIPDPKLKAWQSDGPIDNSEMALIAREALGKDGPFDICELGFCEIKHLILQPDRLYRFVQMPDCEACRNYAANSEP